MILFCVSVTCIMWWLQNRGNGLDMNVIPAWINGYTGRGVVVSILDDGIEKDHPDLKRNYVRLVRLRSSSRSDFCIPQTNLRLSDKAFSVAGPRAWNSLPISVRLTATKSTFCKHLKTHLFRVSYGNLSYSVLSIDFIRLLALLGYLYSASDH